MNQNAETNSTDSTKLFDKTSGSGDKYATFRPSYPKEVFEEIRKLDFLEKKDYLDIATGTGQVFFGIYRDFKGLICGNDVSEDQINSFNKNLEESISSEEKEPERNYLSILSDGFKIREQLDEKGYKECRFSLITIGEAFHWFDTEKLLYYIKSNLLKENGYLVITSYLLNTDEFSYDTNDNSEFNKLCNNHTKKLFKEIYRYVHPKISLSEIPLYPNAKFNEYFNKVRKLPQTITTSMNIEAFIGYISTWSFYNIHRKENPNLPDPLEVFRTEVQEDFKDRSEDIKIITKHEHCTHILSN